MSLFVLVPYVDARLFLEMAKMCRPFVEPTGLDHDDGIDGLSTERSVVLRRKGQYIGGIPLLAVAQMQKDKNQQMLNVSSHHRPFLLNYKLLSIYQPGANQRRFNRMHATLGASLV